MYRAMLEKVMPKPRSSTAQTTSQAKTPGQKERAHLLDSHVRRC